MYSGNIIVEIVWSVWVSGLIGDLLRLVASPAEISIKDAWNELLSNDGHYRRRPDPVLAARIPSEARGYHYLRSKLGIKEWRDGLCIVRHPVLHPVKLGCVHRRHLDGRDLDIAVVMVEFAAQRIGKSVNRMLSGAIRRLE